jgi:lysophospholipase L1-like esterase
VLVVALIAPANAADNEEPAAAQLENAKGLDAFHAALADQKAGRADHPLRISYFGDSLAADDQITNTLRKKLQDLVGDGGAGFVFAAPPHPYCIHRAVSRYVSADWDIRGISTDGAADHLLGLGGSAQTTDGGTIRLAPRGAVKTIDIHYLAQPHGGSLEIACDGKVVDTIETSAPAKKGEFATEAIPDGTKHIELRAHGMVRLFGEALEAQKGAVVDNLGIVNATAKGMRLRNLADHWRNQLAHRQSDLVIIAYGTNEAEWLAPKGKGIEEHERVVCDLLATVRAANPQGSCLVISPLDQIDWRAENMPDRESVPAIVAAQRRAALAQGCAFWDAYTWMGGAGSAKTWFKRGWVVKDYVHPTTAGATRIADALYDALVAP